MSECVYVADNKRVWCIDPSSGAVLWMQAAGGFGRGGSIEAVLLDGGSLLVCLEFQICCLDAQTGERRWATELEGMASSKSFVTRSHPLANRTVVHA